MFTERHPPDLIPIGTLTVQPFTPSWTTSDHASQGIRQQYSVDHAESPNYGRSTAASHAMPTSADRQLTGLVGGPSSTIGIHDNPLNHRAGYERSYSPQCSRVPHETNRNVSGNLMRARNPTSETRCYQNDSHGHFGAVRQGTAFVDASPHSSPRFQKTAPGNRVQYAGSNSSLPISEL